MALQKLMLLSDMIEKNKDSQPGDLGMNYNYFTN